MPLGRVMLYLEEVGLFLSTLYCHPCLFTICDSTTFRSGWFMSSIVFVVLSFEKILKTYMKASVWSIGILSARIKTKVVWAFVISEHSILLSYPNGGGDYSRIHRLRGWPLYIIIITEGEGHTICTTLYPGMYHPFGEEFSRPLWHLFRV